MSVHENFVIGDVLFEVSLIGVEVVRTDPGSSRLSLQSQYLGLWFPRELRDIRNEAAT